jgi:hypothetical protein
MLYRRFCDSDPEFEPGLNRDLAIQAKTATLATKDSPAAQISPPWPWPEPTRTILSREGLPRQETGLGEARPAKRPSGHRTTVRARHGAPLVKGNSHGIEINTIGHVRASGVTRSALFE